MNNTTDGIAVATHGLVLHPDDKVIFYSGDFPNDRYVWEPLRRGGVNLISVPLRAGPLPAAELCDSIGERTRAMCVSYVGYSDGYRAPVGDPAEGCRDEETLRVVDGIQAAGVLDIDV